MALRKRKVGSIDGLTNLLATKLGVAAVMAAKIDVENADNTNTVASTAAVNEIVAGINTQITNVTNSIGGIIDDAAETGSAVTWSIDKLKSYVASVDDSIVVSDINERDNVSDPYDSLIAYVIDTTGDTSLASDEGTAAAYIYVDGQGWKLLQILAQNIDTTPFVQYSDIVDDLTTGGTAVPLSAEQGKELKSQIDAQSGMISVTMKVDTGLAITGDAFSTNSLPIGNIVNQTAEVEVSPGVWDVVDVTNDIAAGDYLLVPETPGEYNGKTCRVSYLMDSNA